MDRRRPAARRGVATRVRLAERDRSSHSSKNAVSPGHLDRPPGPPAPVDHQQQPGQRSPDRHGGRRETPCRQVITSWSGRGTSSRFRASVGWLEGDVRPGPSSARFQGACRGSPAARRAHTTRRTRSTATSPASSYAAPREGRGTAGGGSRSVPPSAARRNTGRPRRRLGDIGVHTGASGPGLAQRVAPAVRHPSASHSASTWRGLGSRHVRTAGGLARPASARALAAAHLSARSPVHPADRARSKPARGFQSGSSAPGRTGRRPLTVAASKVGLGGGSRRSSARKPRFISDSRSRSVCGASAGTVRRRWSSPNRPS